MTRRAVVAAYAPPRPDADTGSRCVLAFVDHLLERGWTVTFVAANGCGDARAAAVLQQRGVAVVDGTTTAMEEVLACHPVDLALFMFWQVAERYGPLVRQLSPLARTVVISIDLQLLRDARRAFLRGAERDAVGVLDEAYASELTGELNAYAAADAVVAVSEKEAALVNDLTGDAGLAHWVPLVDATPRQDRGFAERRGIVFVGNYRHPPNADALAHLASAILPRLDPALVAQHPLYVVGDGVDDAVRASLAGRANVRLVGWVPSVLPYLAAARASVVPLRYGAGTKGKLVEALMAGLPSVATTVGVEGLGLDAGRHVLVADDPAGFASALTRLLGDEALWRRLSDEGRAHAEAVHGAAAVDERISQVVACALARRPKPPTTAPTGADLYARRLRYQMRQKVATSLHDAVRAHVPHTSTAVVMSEGDADLVQLDCRRTWHFPRRPDGGWDGTPRDAGSAIAHLEQLRSEGADHLVVPAPSWWLLERFPELRRHLVEHYTLVVDVPGVGTVYALGGHATNSNGDADNNVNVDVNTNRNPAVNVDVNANGDGNGGAEVLALSPFRSDGDGIARAPTLIDSALLEQFRPSIVAGAEAMAAGQNVLRPRALVVGVYLVDKVNLVDDIVSVLDASTAVTLTQKWVALGKGAPSAAVGRRTVARVEHQTPKFALLNDILAGVDLSAYDFVVSVDDDVVLPHRFLDVLLLVQAELGFSIAQPARTGNSFTDLPIVQRQSGVLARRTQFVEIGPVVSVHRSAFDVVFPFDTSSSMGWGYENVWALRLLERGADMGIIDAVPVDHSLRRSVAHYDWDRADRERSVFWSRNPHLPSEECFTVLDVVPLPNGAQR